MEPQLQPLKILLLTDGISPFEMGGMQSYNAGLINQLVSNDTIQLTVFHTTLKGNKHDAEKYTLPLPHKIIYFNYPSSSKFNLFKYISEQYLLSKNYYHFIEKNNIDFNIIYAHGFTCCYEKFFLLKNNIVSNLHGLNMFQPIKGLKNKLIVKVFKSIAKKSLQNSLASVAIGKNLKKYLLPFIKENNIHILEPAVDNFWINVEQSIPKTENSILFVGRKDPIKGMSVLLKALKNINTNFSFTVVGNWQYSDFETLPYSVDVKGVISNKEELSKLYTTHKIVVLPSFSEGYPLSLLEAILHNCFIIATDVGSVSEILKEYKNKLIIPPLNVTALNKAIVYALNAPIVDDTETRNKIKEKNNWTYIGKETIHILSNYAKYNR